MPEVVQLIKTSAFRIINSVNDGFNQVLAPHALTQRFIYTVPAGFVLYQPLITAQNKRVTAAVTADLSEIVISVIRPDTVSVITSRVILASNTVYAFDRVIIPFPNALREGYSIRYDTSDSSTGGTVEYTLSLHGLLIPV